MNRKIKNVVRFTYSRSYERTLLKLAGKKITPKHSKEAIELTRFVHKIWNKYEFEILNLFKEIYKIEIEEKRIDAFISLVLPNSYSHPLTISLTHWPDIKTNPRHQRAFIYTTIHELAHYFAYTRKSDAFFSKIYKNVKDRNLLGDRGSNIHYLIQAVEFGIVAEVIGSRYAEYSRKWKIEHQNNDEYGKSAKALKQHGVPLDKSCLEFINKSVL